MIPSTGAVSASDINTELGRSAGSTVSANDAAVRLLCGNDARLVGGSVLSLADLRGKSAMPFQAYMKNYAGGAGCKRGDGVNSYPLASYAGRSISDIYTETTGDAVYTSLGMYGTPYPTFYALAAWQASGEFIGFAKYTDKFSRGSGSPPEGTYLAWTWYASYLDLRPFAGTTLKFVLFTG